MSNPLSAHFGSLIWHSIVLAVSRTTTTQPTSASLTPTFDSTFRQIENADHTQQKALRESVRSSILSSFSFLTVWVSDSKTRERLLCHHWCIWLSCRTHPYVKRIAYPLGLALNPRSCPYHSLDTESLWRESWTRRSWIFLPFKPFTDFASQHRASTWDMLQSWTGIDLGKLVESRLNTPENAILMCRTQHLDFGRYEWYLDKNAVCCSSQLMIPYTNWLKIDSILIIQTSTRHKGLVQTIDLTLERSLSMLSSQPRLSQRWSHLILRLLEFMLLLHVSWVYLALFIILIN